MCVDVASHPLTTFSWPGTQMTMRFVNTWRLLPRNQLNITPPHCLVFQQLTAAETGLSVHDCKLWKLQPRTNFRTNTNIFTELCRNIVQQTDCMTSLTTGLAETSLLSCHCIFCVYAVALPWTEAWGFALTVALSTSNPSVLVLLGFHDPSNLQIQINGSVECFNLPKNSY